LRKQIKEKRFYVEKNVPNFVLRKGKIFLKSNIWKKLLSRQIITLIWSQEIIPTFASYFCLWFHWRMINCFAKNNQYKIDLCIFSLILSLSWKIFLFCLLKGCISNRFIFKTRFLFYAFCFLKQIRNYVLLFFLWKTWRFSFCSCVSCSFCTCFLQLWSILLP